MKQSSLHAVVLSFIAGCVVVGGLPGGAVMAQASSPASGEVVASVAVGGGDQQTDDARFADAPPGAPLADYRVRLLDVAMAAASKLPIEPHLKNRSRAQHAVAKAALELDQPRLALGYMDRIDDWRRGAVSAEYMLYAARRGHTDKLERYDRIARASAKLATQDWRQEYIHLTLAQAQLLLGNPEPAEAFDTQLQNDSFVGRTTQIDAQRLDPGDDASYQRLMAALDRMIAKNHYEIIINSGQVYVTLYDKYYGDASRREAIEQKLRSAYKHMPGPETIDLLIGLADVAAGHDDLEQARSLLDESQGLYAQAAWTAHREYEYEYAGKLAEAFVRAGDVAGARALLDAALAQFDERESEIYNLWRPDCLRPLAGAYQLVGDEQAARALYGRALAAGALNPNGRPQAEDLSATCTSMSLYAFEPDAALWDEIHRLRDQLSAPW